MLRFSAFKIPPPCRCFGLLDCEFDEFWRSETSPVQPIRHLFTSQSNSHWWWDAIHLAIMWRQWRWQQANLPKSGTFYLSVSLSISLSRVSIYLSPLVPAAEPNTAVGKKKRQTGCAETFWSAGVLTCLNDPTIDSVWLRWYIVHTLNN